MPEISVPEAIEVFGYAQEVGPSATAQVLLIADWMQKNAIPKIGWERTTRSPSGVVASGPVAVLIRNPNVYPRLSEIANFRAEDDYGMDRTRSVVSQLGLLEWGLVGLADLINGGRRIGDLQLNLQVGGEGDWEAQNIKIVRSIVPGFMNFDI